MSWSLVRRGEERFLAFTYTDRDTGRSAKGVRVAGAAPTDAEALAAASRPDLTLRLEPGVEVTALADEDVARLGLPLEPEWMAFFRQPPGPWTSDPRLAGQFHAEFPDDLQARFHFPGSQVVEQMWVRLDRAVPEQDAYEGQLLNNARSDPAIAAGLRVRVRPVPGQQPVWISPAAEENLAGWGARCEGCGFGLVLEPIPALIARQFANAPQDVTVEAFTSRCAVCGGTQLIQRQASLAARGEPVAAPPIAPLPAGFRLAPLIALGAAAGGALAWWLLR